MSISEQKLKLPKSKQVGGAKCFCRAAALVVAAVVAPAGPPVASQGWDE